MVNPSQWKGEVSKLLPGARRDQSFSRTGKYSVHWATPSLGDYRVMGLKDEWSGTLQPINPEPFFLIHGSQLDLRPSTCLRCPGRRHRHGHAGASIDHGLRPCTHRSWHFTGHACPQVGHPASKVKPYILLLNPASRLTPAGPSSWGAMSNVRYLTLLAPTMVFCSY